MKKLFSLAAILFALSTATFAQKENDEKNEKGEKESKEKVMVPAAVKKALAQKYPEAKKIMWEAEKGNFEANWGGKSGEDNSVLFTPAGKFLEIVKLIPVSELPAAIPAYVKANYKRAKITEAGKAMDAAGKITYEAEIKNKVLIFSEAGAFIKVED